MKPMHPGLFVCLLVAVLGLTASCATTGADTPEASAPATAAAPAAEAAEPADSAPAAARKLAYTPATDDGTTCKTIAPDATGNCPTYQQEDLCTPRVIPAKGGVLDTRMDVAKKMQCVPRKSNGAWSFQAKELRNYGAPDAHGNMVYGFPGPTFKMRRRSVQHAGAEGDRFRMLLSNSMGPTTVKEQMECFRRADDRFENDVHPNCFHGNETTNFHFHGFHVSPQPLQDYVLLKLYPKDTPGIRNYDPKLTYEELRKYTEIGGSYRYDVDPLPYNQPEGTHWYHAHHHGATAMQVINGMAGSILVEGPFDDWLNDFYGYDGDKPRLKERLFIVQQINDVLGFATPVVNGQGDPTVPIRPGEVQRWRVVSATTQASAQIDLQLKGLVVCQIAMDGVQFGPENYRKQPLLRASSSPTEGFCRKDVTFELSPGNRADFLVKMPIDMEDDDGRIEVMQRVVGSITEEKQMELGVRPEMSLESSLMILEMMEPMATEMKFPPALPALPPFLAPPTPQPGNSKEIAYQMHGAATSNPAPVFKIDGMQVRDCVPKKMTMQRGVDERWTLYNMFDGGPARVEDPDGNNRGVAHPFHIHTNPFYVVRDGNTVFDPGIWQDTIALPLVADGDPNPKRASSVELLMEFEDFTGGYVQHCHILGHEDRGMMTLVQTLCPNGKFGTPHPNRPDACEITREPLPICPN